MLLPAGKGGQQQGAFIILIKNVQLWHPLLAMGDTIDIFEIVLLGVLCHGRI
jgi:hypothetical protein